MPPEHKTLDELLHEQKHSARTITGQHYIPEGQSERIARVDLYYDNGASYLKGMTIRGPNNVELQRIGLVDNEFNVKHINLADDEYIVGVRGKYSSDKYNSVFSNFQFITIRIAE